MTSTPDLPPFTGYVETTTHALRLIHAARQGYIPRITRRLNDSERRTMITSGSVFVFSVDESGIKRWTDGLLWSPSRIVGNFLVYREINERNNSRANASNRKPYPLESQPRGLCGSQRSSPEGNHVAFKGPGHLTQGDHSTFKINGLIKKTITVTVEGSDLHLISYYTADDIRSGKLRKPSSRPDIMSLPMSLHLFRFTNFRVPPKIEIGPDGKQRIAPDPEDHDNSPPVECKTEGDANYLLSAAHQWTTQDVEAHTNRLQQACYTASSPSYSDSRSDIHQGSWSPSPSPTYSHSTVRRRDTGGQGDSWGATHSHANRWRSDSGSSIQSMNDRYRDRGNAVFQGSGNRDILSQRQSWSRDDVAHGGDRYLRTPQLGSCYTPQVSAPNAYLKTPQSLSAWQPGHAGDGVDACTTPSQNAYDVSYTHAGFTNNLIYRYN